MSDRNWRDRALCVGDDPERWFDGKHREHALRICAACPVADKCAEMGEQFGAYRGVWGGVVHHETNAGPSTTQPYIEHEHGTNAGYQAHYAAGTQPCVRCTIAHQFACQEREARRSA